MASDGTLPNWIPAFVGMTRNTQTETQLGLASPPVMIYHRRSRQSVRFWRRYEGRDFSHLPAPARERHGRRPRGQYAMTRLARDRGWDAVATGQHYLSEGVRQVQLIPFLARLAAEAGEMTGIAGVLLATAQPRGGRRMHRLARRDLARQFRIRRRPRLPRCRVRGLRRAARLSGAPFRAMSRRRQAAVDRGQRQLPDDVCKLTNVTMTCRPVQKPYPPIWIAANADKRPCCAPRGSATPGSSTRMPRCRPSSGNGALPADWRALGKPSPPARPMAREISRRPRRRSRPPAPISTRNTRLRRMGPGQGVAGRRKLPPAVRAIARDRFILGSPEECSSSCGRAGKGRGEFPGFPHPLERHAGRPRVGQHAPDQRRVVAAIASDRAGGWLANMIGCKFRIFTPPGSALKNGRFRETKAV